MRDGVARIGAGGDVEEGDFVRALRVVSARGFDRVAGVDDVDELHALDHAPGIDIEARDDAFGERHGAIELSARVERRR